MNYKRIWKAALVVLLVISAVLLAPSVLKLYELPDNVVRILGVADMIVLFVTVFSFVRSYKDRQEK